MSKYGLFTARGRFLIRVIEKPGITIEELAADLYLTKRSVWGMVGELRGVGYITTTRKGRTHHYTVSSFGLAELRKLTENSR